MSREIWVDVEITRITEPKRSVKVLAFVDNGSTDSAMPATLLRKLGVEVEGAQEYEIWGKRRVRRRTGNARFKIGKRSGIARVTFEPRYETPTIGATTLETLGYDIDKKNGGLKTYIPRGPTMRVRAHYRLPARPSSE